MMNDMTRDGLRELRARAMRLDNMGVQHCNRIPWEKITESMKEGWLRPAEATMKAEDAAGLAVVPYGATKAMQNAACANFNKVAGLNDAIHAGNLLKE